MKIVSLQAENFKRLKAVEIKPDGSTVVITGKNAQGKSSILDSIFAAVGGAADFSALHHIGLTAQAPVRERVVLDHPSVGLELFEERRVPRRHRRDQEHRERHVRGRHEPVRHRQPGLSIVHCEEGDPLVDRQTLEDRRARSVPP